MSFVILKIQWLHSPCEVSCAVFCALLFVFSSFLDFGHGSVSLFQFMSLNIPLVSLSHLFCKLICLWHKCEKAIYKSNESSKGIKKWSIPLQPQLSVKKAEFGLLLLSTDFLISFIFRSPFCVLSEMLTIIEYWRDVIGKVQSE